jgi:hypothetical protein
MDEVARCAWGEILQTAPSGSSLFSFMEDLLTPGPDLVWQAAGPGRGKEMRRAFSALFGRFFARAYLETYHGFTWFAAIDGDNFQFLPFRVRHKSGSRAEMPDWLCGGPNGLVGIAEAKGSHQKGNAPPRGKPGPIRTAEGQIKSVTVDMQTGPTGHRQWRSKRVKGWAIMSRWGVAAPARAPYLYALDPETEGDKLTPKESGVLAQAIARVHIEQTARGLGLLPPTEKIAVDPQGVEPDRLRTWSVRLADGDSGSRFLGRFMSPFGPLDLDPQQAKRIGELLPNPAMLRFVGLDATVMELYRQNSHIETRPRHRIGEAAIVGPDGLVVAPLSQVMEIGEIGPIA